MSTQFGEGEAILADENANLFRGIEAVGGHMIITDRRIVFKPHPLNIQRSVVEIPLSDIEDVRERSTLGIVPNGILIRTKSGKDYKFVVWHREKLIALIKNAISKLHGLPAGAKP